MKAPATSDTPNDIRLLRSSKPALPVLDVDLDGPAQCAECPFSRSKLRCDMRLPVELGKLRCSASRSAQKVHLGDQHIEEASLPSRLRIVGGGGDDGAIEVRRRKPLSAHLCGEPRNGEPDRDL